MNALPTSFLVLLLAFYLKFMLFKPLDKVLAERYAMTEGAKKAAEQSLQLAGNKVSEYEAKLEEARVGIYREQEEFFRKLQDEQAAQTKDARAETEKRVHELKQSLAKETADAKASLESQSEFLANQIADSILNRRVA